MKCPACGNALSEMTAGNVTVDVCKGGCGGIWFDNFELKKVDEAHESAGEALLNIPRNESLKVDHAAKRTCPKCQNIVMLKNFFSVKREVEIDSCGSCNGVWLDAGELGRIRSQFKTEAEREKAAHDDLEDVLGGKLAEEKIKIDQGLKKAQDFAKMFKFICPSSHIKGKQDWGAF